ncbi:MAG TPA: nucleotidyltransferase domain-containing protein [Syntrophomonadaceae bacterium]|nr:nucleotidyltransferase domain-containing protein [Syntrophomonadaceae bacterium]
MSKKEKYFSKEFLREFDRLNELNNEQNLKHKNQAMEIAKKIANLMKRDYAVQKVYLYGSLAYGDFSSMSDIDLFLVGFSGNYWRALSQAQEIAGNIEVSLACEEDCFVELVEEVYEKGEEI